MNPELKAILEANTETQMRYPSRDQSMMMTMSTFNSALHWRENHLYCGPISFGFVHENEDRRGRSGWSCNPWVMDIDPDFATEEDARAALEAAAREQITEWFKEQRG